MTQQILPLILGIHLVSFGVLTIRLQPEWFYLLYHVKRFYGHNIFYCLIYILYVCIYYTFCAASFKILNTHTHTPFTYYFIFQHILFLDIIKINNNNIDILTTVLDIIVIKLVDIKCHKIYSVYNSAYVIHNQFLTIRRRPNFKIILIIYRGKS